jgi:hypothetical protein
MARSDFFGSSQDGAGPLPRKVRRHTAKVISAERALFGLDAWVLARLPPNHSPDPCSRLQAGTLRSWIRVAVQDWQFLAEQFRGIGIRRHQADGQVGHVEP